MSTLLESAKKIQTWIHTHPRKATIVRSVIDEFDNAILSMESQQSELKPSDEDIKAWITKQNFADKNPIIVYVEGLRDGAKAMRDGKISPQPDNIK